MNTKTTGVFALTGVFCTGVLLAQIGPTPMICNNHESRLGACVPNSDSRPDTPTPADPGDPGDPTANPPVPPRPPRPAVPCGGLMIQINERILQCEGGVPGGHCIDSGTIQCAWKVDCIRQRHGDTIYCGNLIANSTGIAGWFTIPASYPCITRQRVKTDSLDIE
jgi:hypothetical protein